LRPWSSPHVEAELQRVSSQHNTNTSSLIIANIIYSPPVARLPVSNLLPRLPASLHHLPEVSRSPTDISLVPSLSVRSVVTRSPQSFSSESSPSNVSFVRSLRISSLISVSNHLLSAHSKNPSRPIWYLSLRTPTCVPSTPSVSQSKARTSNLLAVSVESDLRWFLEFHTSHLRHDNIWP